MGEEGIWAKVREGSQKKVVRRKSWEMKALPERGEKKKQTKHS